MNFIMDLIGPKLSELSALELEKLAIFDFVYTLASANIDQSVSNLVINIYAHKISYEFNYGRTRTRTSGVIFPLIWKNC